MEDTNIKTNNNNNNNNDECMKLKNLMYKTMLFSGNNLNKKTKSTDELINIEKFLEDEKNNNKNEPWSKLDKTIKTIKLINYVEKYKTDKNLSEEEILLMVNFFKDCLDRKKLARVKDVIYDKTTGNIKEIPALVYNKNTKHFTLKNIDKRVSTLKSLPPKKEKNGKTKITITNENFCEIEK